MSCFVPKSSFGPSSDIVEFSDVLMSSRRILALCGAGLSAASGLDTFRGAGGMWRNHQATSLATPEAFARDPGLVVSITSRGFSISSPFSGSGHLVVSISCGVWF
jgi:hypothetical protein